MRCGRSRRWGGGWGLGGFWRGWGNGVRGGRGARVEGVMGGNGAGMLVHPKTGEMVHEGAGEAMKKKVPLVNWWWDEVRAKPRLGRVMGPGEFMKVLGRGSVVN